MQPAGSQAGMRSQAGIRLAGQVNWPRGAVPAQARFYLHQAPARSNQRGDLREGNLFPGENLEAAEKPHPPWIEAGRTEGVLGIAPESAQGVPMLENVQLRIDREGCLRAGQNNPKACVSLVLRQFQSWH